MRPRRRFTGTDLALVAGFAALIAVCSLLPALTVGAVPITLQVFAVLLAGAALGPVRGFLAVVLYLVVGAAGLPVFSGGGAGLAAFVGPTGGYLIGFPLAAWLCGVLVSALPHRTVRSSLPAVFLAALVANTVFVYPLGIAGLVVWADSSWTEALTANAVFWLSDLPECLLVALVATAVHRAFPDLLAHASPRSRQPQEPATP